MHDSLVFKQASTASEFEQIHRLNYRTFAEEIGQYAPDGSGVLVDKFHDKNVYFIAVESERVVGMVAVHDQPPFSAEARLTDPDALDRLGGPLLEVRLLALEAESRNRLVFAGLLWEVYRYAHRLGYSHIIISGITEKLEMYERIGFRRLGDGVASGAATFVPMALSLENPPERLVRDTQLYLARQNRLRSAPLVSFMPGPVEIAEPVRKAFAARPISHRSPAFLEAYERIRARLSALAGGKRVAIQVGSGTTANDAAGLHLKALAGSAPGLVLVNGEFGERLAGLAARASLKYKVLRWAWGWPWDLDRVKDEISSGARWVWAVHLETSTGVLNDTRDLLEITRPRGVRVALDCVSSVGATPLHLDGASLATGVSGKALGSYAGLSFVFADDDVLACPLRGAPASLDVRAAIECAGSQFTVPSPLIMALDTALALNYATAEERQSRFRCYAELGAYLRATLRDLGLPPVAAETDAAPCIATFVSPYPDFVGECRALGFEVGGESGYLHERGWAQLAIMGAIERAHISRFASQIRRSERLVAATA
jgi:aspartate aminotransferase-like enzyme/N-acyl-L-homoserine lactone synthetase